jgi:tetratricopeptide (TPR) repeat protein
VGGKSGWWGSVRRSGTATGGDQSNINTGIQIIGDVPAARIPRSAYLHQVRQIFPWQLEDRDTELAELAAFCTLPEAGPYAWWQGPAWAGKSALMAWFVLHPPERVRVVPFFITARYAGQSDRGAFLEMVLEQLAEAAGQPMPDLLTEANRQAWFGRLLQEAAMACAQNGVRLVLVVDGLDEDQGVTGGPETYSIAALLPAVPPEGVRVIVSGRPDPPVPADVPQRHPLRDAAIVRPLSISPQAQMIRDDAERELGRLLDGSGLGRELLGLVTAAGGGLSGDDLAELTGESSWQVERVLRGVSGRTFRSRDNRWQTSAARSFVLAHEELQQAALRSLGSGELAALRDRLHEWAERYREQGWPAGTPEYLLRGYHRLLHATGDLARMTALATDRARQDRMLDVSQGDAAALAEITSVQGFACGQDPPDLTALVNLAIARDRLSQRNSNIPARLPAVWVSLGNLTRAEALAYSISDPSDQPEALAAIAGAHAKAGRLDQARRIADQAEVTHGSTIDPFTRAWAVTAVAKALAKAGELELARQFAHRAETVTSSVTDPSWQAQAKLLVVRFMISIGEPGQARELIHQAQRIAESITRLIDAARVFRSVVEELVNVANALARAGESGQARQLIEEARDVAYSITDPSHRAMALAAIAKGLAEAVPGQTHHFTQRAEAVARSITDPLEQAMALAILVGPLAEAGELDHALAVARSISVPAEQARALTNLVAVLAEAGELDRAETIARTITSLDGQAQALAEVVEALGQAGELDRAETIARTITSPYPRASALAAVAEALAEAGELDRARQLAQLAEIAARSITNPAELSSMLAAMAWALKTAGEPGRARRFAQLAETAARTETDPFEQALALGTVAGMLAEAGEHDHAESVARTIADPAEQARALNSLVEALATASEFGHAESVARTIADPAEQAWALVTVAHAVARTGEADRSRQLAYEAEAVARTINSPAGQASALADVAQALARAGEADQASHLAHQAQGLAGAITDPSQQAEMLVAVAAALARAGEPERAMAAARSITDQYEQAQALAAVAEALAEDGKFDQAMAIASSIADPYSRAKALADLAWALVEAGELNQAGPLALQAEVTARLITKDADQAEALATVVQTLAKAGEHDHAEAIARSIPDPDSRRRALADIADQLLTPSGPVEAGPRPGTDGPAVGTDVPSAAASALARSRRLLAFSLAQPSDCVELLPILAKADPSAAFAAAKNFQHLLDR